MLLSILVQPGPQSELPFQKKIGFLLKSQRHWWRTWLCLYLALTWFFPVFSGVPGLKAERFEEGMEVKHCALSLVGEPIMYPEINRLLKLLHQHGISSFLVTNAQFPEEIR